MSVLLLWLLLFLLLECITARALLLFEYIIAIHKSFISFETALSNEQMFATSGLKVLPLSKRHDPKN